ncbi:CynX/NimT family MFS transporter [Actinomadura atramentaria]|uniref:MFS transporter n=1 Tax=Actinomadura atramentaria TaxID=1990 RepID=UPI00036BA731|nr:MFS transporter [Actinomadura atramentaria]
MPAPAAPALRDPRPLGRAGAALVVGFVLLSLNTRVAFGQIGPLAPVTDLPGTAVTVLGLLPPLVMGLCAPAAPAVRRRLGEERGLFWAGIVLLAGTLLRPLGLPGLLAGTAVVAAATAVVNVLVPVLVQRRFPARRVGAMMGVYAMCMGAGSALVAAAVVPVARATGGSWHAAVALAIVPAALAAAGMAPQLRHAHVPPPRAARTADRPHVARTWLAWSLLCFFGVQTLLFYTTLAWLPTILVDAGVGSGTAGSMQALFIVGVAVGGFAAPVLAAARADQRPVLVASLAVCAAGYAGLLAAPAAAPALWALVLGAGLGAGQSLPGVLYARRAADHDHVAALSTMAQTGGYLLAAAGPAAVAGLHAATGSWTLPLAAMLALLAANVPLSSRAGHG